MKYEQLIAEIAKQTNNTNSYVKEVLNAFQEIVVKQVKNGEKIRLPKLGTFEKVERAPKVTTLKNKTYNVPKREALKFTATAPVKRLFRGE